MAKKYMTTKKRIPYRRLPIKIIKGQVKINLGADNFCYIHTLNHRRVDLTEWMKKFAGKNVIIEVRIQ